MASAKHISALRGRFRERFHELAAQIGKNRARAVFAALIDAACDSSGYFLREVLEYLDEPRLQPLLEDVVALLRAFERLRQAHMQADAAAGLPASAPTEPTEPARRRTAGSAQTVAKTRGRSRLRFFACDRHDRLHRVSAKLIKAAWDCCPFWNRYNQDSFIPSLVNRCVGLRLVTVVYEPAGKVRGFYYLRVPLDRWGEIVPGARVLCFQAQLDARRCTSSKALDQMYGPRGFPEDLPGKLAVALDIPRDDADQQYFRGFGGPLAVAAAFNLSIEEATALLDEMWARGPRVTGS